MKLTKEQIERYLAAEGAICPSCAGKIIEGVSRVDVEGTHCYQDVTCTECNFSWTDEYKLVGLTYEEDE